MNLFRYIKYERLLAKRRKHLAKFRSECLHFNVMSLEKTQWTKRSPLECSFQYSDTYEADHFKCKRCGVLLYLNIVHLEHRSYMLQPKEVYITETTNMVTGEKTTKIS